MIDCSLFGWASGFKQNLDVMVSESLFKSWGNSWSGCAQGLDSVVATLSDSQRKLPEVNLVMSPCRKNIFLCLPSESPSLVSSLLEA